MATTQPTPAARVNIVMRTRNRPLLLARALDDVLAQSLDDWTLTIVNDGGDAGPVDDLVGERAAAFADRVRILHNHASGGMEAASNQGVRAVESTYVAIHDDDDTWDPSFLATTTAWLEDHPDAPAVSVRTLIVWERITGEAVRRIGSEVFAADRDQVTLADLLRYNHCVPISMLYRRERLIAAGLFDETLPVTGDWEANLRLALQGTIGFLPDRPLAFWHQRPGAGGDLGNSVVALHDQHRLQDALVRDRALVSWVQQEGLGLPLYLTRYLDDRFAELQGRIDRMERRTVIGFTRRLGGRVLRGLSGRGAR